MKVITITYTIGTSIRDGIDVDNYDLAVEMKTIIEEGIRQNKDSVVILPEGDISFRVSIHELSSSSKEDIVGIQDRLLEEKDKC